MEIEKQMRELYSEIEAKTIPTLPLWMRLNVFANKLSKVVSDGITDDQINWDYVNEMCTKNLDIFDYNMYRTVKTVEEFMEQRSIVIGASLGITAWHKHKCKDCGEEFYMDFNEVHFFQEKGLNLPKRCKVCRDKRKTNATK